MPDVRSNRMRNVMTLAGLTLPELSDYDPPIAGEGSIDPMGLAAISDRLADRLVPGLRARMMRWQSTELRGAIGIVTQEPAHRWRALCRCLRVVEPLDHGRQGVCSRHSTMQVDRVSSGVLLDRLAVLVDGVGCQVPQFQTAGVQHRDPRAATTVGSVGTLRISWGYSSFVTQQWDQTSVEKRQAHSLAAVDEQQLRELTVLLIEER